jgi:hypothetical protein
MRRLQQLLPLLAIAGLLLSCAGASPTVGKRYALVYGVTRYLGGTADPVGSDTFNFPAQGTNTPNLAFPGNDAVDVAAMLASKGYQVRLRCVDVNGDAFLDGANAPANAPTRAMLENVDLPYFAAKLGPEDTFLFYYSGHGTQDAQATTEYIVPYGSVYSTGATSWAVDTARLVSQGELAAMLDSLPTSRTVVILDSCNSGGFIGNTLEVDRVPRTYAGVTMGISAQVISRAISNYAAFPGTADGISPYGGSIVIAAAGADEFSYEGVTLPDGTPLNHGVMTYFLLHAASADLDGDGAVTTMELYAFLKAGIDTDWNSDPGVIYYGETFSPHISGGPVDWVLF